MALEKELETYRAQLPSMKDHEGKFVLIQGDRVDDFFGTYEDAIKAGYQKFKLEPFLVKQILTEEPIFYITRDVHPTAVSAR